MASSQIIFAVLVGFTALSYAAGAYTTKFDNVDLDAILKSDRLLTNYYKCLMDEGPCTPDATELKQTLPDALKTKCASCSDPQREGAQKVIRFLVDNKPDAFLAIEKKYDPEGNFRTQFEAEAKNNGITLPARKN